MDLSVIMELLDQCISVNIPDICVIAVEAARTNPITNYYIELFESVLHLELEEL